MKAARSRDHSIPYMRILLAAVLLVLCASGYLTYKTISDFRYWRGVSQKLIRAEGNIRYYDEVLTMSARANAFLADPQWKRRYDIFQERLTRELKSTSELLSTPSKPLEEISQANERIYELESQSFRLVAAGNAAQAQRIILGEEYEHQKSIYAHGLAHLSDQIDTFITARQARLKQNTLLSVCFVMALVIIFLLAFLRTFRVLGALLLMENIRGEVARRMLFNGLSEAEGNIRSALEFIVSETRGDRAFFMRKSNREQGVHLQQWWNEDADLSDVEVNALWARLAEACEGGAVPLRELSRLPDEQRKKFEPILRLDLARMLCAHVSAGQDDEYYLCWGSRKRRSARLPPDGAFLQAIAEIMISAIRNLEYESALTRLATTDSLTQVNNRRHFTDCLAQALKLYHRTKRPCALLMLDLDHFKAINDTFGHVAGDTVLLHFADALRRELREIDTIGRLGGEEFGVILPDTDANAAIVVAERLREDLENAEIEADGEIIKVTVCVGVTVLDPGDKDTTQPLSRADDALYCAKEGGRNRVRQRMPSEARPR